MVYSPEEVEESAKGMIGDFLITKQTGAEGRICNSVMVTERKYTRKEFYIAFMNERSMNGPCCIASSEGGVNIEEVAASNPDAIVKFPIDCVEGAMPILLLVCVCVCGRGDDHPHVCGCMVAAPGAHTPRKGHACHAILFMDEILHHPC